MDGMARKAARSFPGNSFFPNDRNAASIAAWTSGRNRDRRSRNVSARKRKMPLFQENRPDFTNRRAAASAGFSGNRRALWSVGGGARHRHARGGVPPFRLEQDVPGGDAEGAGGEMRCVLFAGHHPDVLLPQEGGQPPDRLPDHRAAPREVEKLLGVAYAALRPEPGSRSARHHDHVIHGLSTSAVT